MVLGEVVVCREIQGGDEFILQEFISPVFFIKTERRPNTCQKVSELIDFNESSSLRVEVRPPLSEGGIHLIVKESRLLDLRVVIPLQDHCDEQLQEDERHNKVVARKEGVGQGSRGAANSDVSRLRVVLVGRILEALVEDAVLHYEGGLESVPRVSSRHHEEHHEGVYEILEIHPIIHQSGPHLGAKEDHTKDRIHVDYQK